jgi:hypothetical protein
MILFAKFLFTIFIAVVREQPDDLRSKPGKRATRLY